MEVRFSSDLPVVIHVEIEAGAKFDSWRLAAKRLRERLVVRPKPSITNRQRANMIRTALLRARKLAHEVALDVEAWKGSLPSESSPALMAVIERWLLDSGSCFDIVNKNMVENIPSAVTTRRAEPMVLETANGNIKADSEANVSIGRLGTQTTAIVLPDSPSVLSLGRRCMVEGYKFEWPPYGPPVLTSPNGQSIILEVENMVPVLVASATGVEQSMQHARETTPSPKKKKKPTGAGGNTSVCPAPPLPLPPDHYLTHTPKDSRCPICMKCRAQRKQCRRIKTSVREEAGIAPPKKFGDIITGDHIIIADDEAAGRHHEKSSLAVLDRGTGGIGNFPTQKHTKEATKKALQKFVGPTDKVALFYTDGAGELGTAADELGWRHDASTPHRPQTNGVAERNVRRIIEGTRTALHASALSHCWWPEASQCFCNLYNFTTKVRDDCTPYELRHGVSFQGLLIPFGALVSFYPAGPRQKQMAKFEPRQVDGIFIGYHMQSGGKWSGDYFVVSREDFTTVAHERDIHVQRLKEVTPSVTEPGKPVRFAASLPSFRRPDADDMGQTETSADTTVKLEPHVKNEVKEEPLEEAAGNSCEELPPVIKQEPALPDTWEQRGSRLVRVHNTPRTKLFCPSDVPDSPPPIPINDIDVLRSTTTNSDMQDEKSIEDVWFGPQAHRVLSNPWIGETFFDPIPPPCRPGYTWVGGRLTKIQTTTRPPDIYPELWTLMSKKQKRLAQDAWKIKASMIERAREDRILENAGGRSK